MTYVDGDSVVDTRHPDRNARGLQFVNNTDVHVWQLTAGDILIELISEGEREYVVVPPEPQTDATHAAGAWLYADSAQGAIDRHHHREIEYDKQKRIQLRKDRGRGGERAKRAATGFESLGQPIPIVKKRPRRRASIDNVIDVINASSDGDSKTDCPSEDAVVRFFTPETNTE